MDNKHVTFQAGQVIRFTYRHVWPTDANSREPYKEILVIHTGWGPHKLVHGIDLKHLTPMQLKILQIVMNPINNKSDRDNEEHYNVTVRGKKKDQQVLESDRLIALYRAEEDLMKETERQASEMKVQVASQKRRQHWMTLQKLKQEIQSAVDFESKPENQPRENKRMDDMPPLAADILRKMKPSMMSKNPVAFYRTFLKRFLGQSGGGDVYRTFYRGAMSAIQVEPRWGWSEEHGRPKPPERPKQPQQPKGAGPFKHNISSEEQAQIQANKEALKTRLGAASMGDKSSGMKTLPPGAAEGGALGTRAGVSKKDSNNTIKTAKPPVKRPKRNQFE